MNLESIDKCSVNTDITIFFFVNSAISSARKLMRESVNLMTFENLGFVVICDMLSPQILENTLDQLKKYQSICLE